MNDKYLSISAVTRYLKSRFDGDSNLQKVYLKRGYGEKYIK